MQYKETKKSISNMVRKKNELMSMNKERKKKDNLQIKYKTRPFDKHFSQIDVRFMIP